MEVSGALQFLRLNNLNSVWVEVLWDYEFTEVEPLDATIEEEISVGGVKAFTRLYSCLLPYASDQRDDSGQIVWEELGNSGGSTRSLVALLAYLVLKGRSNGASAHQRTTALQAASLYLLLLGVPGSIANQMFHQVLFDTCSDLPSHCWPQDFTKKRKKDAAKGSQAEGKRSKPPRKDHDEVDMEEEHEEDEEEVHLSAKDLVTIRDGVVLLVQSLLRLLKTFSLKDTRQSAINCTQIFTKLVYFEAVQGQLRFSAQQDVSRLESLPEMAFCGLRLLLSQYHGDQKESLRRIFHRLLYVILMMSKANRGRPALLVISQTVVAARGHALQFVCHLVEEMKETALPFVQILLQHICFQMLEKCEYRCHGSQAVGVLVALLPSEDYASFVKWLSGYSRHTKMVYRLFAVDVVMVLLQQPERAAELGAAAEVAALLPHRYLVQSLLFSRRTDSSPTVRGHALSCLAQVLEMPSLNASRAVQDLFTTSGISTVLEGESTEGTIGAQQTQKTYRTLSFKTLEITNTGDPTGYEGKENLALLMRRVADCKTGVRKSALQAILALLKHGVIPMTTENLSVLSDRCRDPALSVKKKALQCLGELLTARPDSGVVQRAWLQGVVPALVDAESSVQEKALEALEETLLCQVKGYSPQRHLDAPQRLAWDLLGLLCYECPELSRYFSRAFSVWSKQNKFSKSFCSSLLSHTEAEHAGGAWLLLSQVARCTPNLPLTPVLQAWDHMLSTKEVAMTTCCHILSVVGDVAEYFNEDTQSRIVDELMSWLKTMELSLEVMSAAMETLFQLGRKEDIKQTQAFLGLHCGGLVSMCETYLAGILLRQTGGHDLDQDLMVKHLHLLGVASLHSPAHVGKRTVLLVESILSSQRDAHTGPDEPPESSTQTRPNSLPTKVRAHAVITLGRLCLQHEDLTQQYLPVFARELQEGAELAFRNNLVVIMCDLCVRYTNMVDCYIPNISSCLRDDQQVIREQTLIMLTNLLQEEFVKWKGSLFFRFVTVLVDPVPAIASLCEFCLVHLLLKKNTAMFSQHFIECIFHFNEYRKHKAYNHFPETDRERTRFSLKGQRNREKRFRIYRFLLEHFTDAQRVSITNKINQTILGCFADDELPLDADGAEILAETFSILSLKELKLQAASAPAGGAAADEPEEEGQNMATLHAAQKKVISQFQKKAFMENTVPIIIALKNMLELRRSPVIRDLMAYLQVAMKDLKGEVKELFSGDQQLAAELEFNLQEKENLENQTSRMDSVQNSPVPAAAKLMAPPHEFSTPQPTKANHVLLSRVATTESRQHLQTPRGQSGRRQTLNSLAHLQNTVLSKNSKDRAISTPVDVEFDCTFGEAVSAIMEESQTSPGSDRSFIQPKKAPAPRQWDVKSPLRPTKTKSRRSQP
ncbi:condensin-2 complex subunit D3 [Gadus macrocephalus]|uniref:condensin-2 complex subunit D3 n=1 Tax=Gadus macrocephalus TaxID=80720 RepID=UPI0028CB1866|nr:condensin-2 complex subunit D3 [Gadus macrocephalus]